MLDGGLVAARNLDAAEGSRAKPATPEQPLIKEITKLLKGMPSIPILTPGLTPTRGHPPFAQRVPCRVMHRNPGA